MMSGRLSDKVCAVTGTGGVWAARPRWHSLERVRRPLVAT
jgi:hypothetical protein